ncbi:MAG TPA: BON domain-containing protein [Gemmatales bacterium]|nr:BON domain-containing protein [Gemmatales bacterium]
MKSWYLFASVVAALTVPSMVLAQTGANGFSGSSGSSTGTGGSRGNSSGSGSSTGLAGSANTTLLGNQVNLNFNSVFGTSPQLANTTADNFAAYRPSGTSSSSGTGAGGSSFSGGSGITNSGLGSGTGGLSGLGTGARTGTGTGGLSSGGMTGSLGTGGTAGGLAGNRGGLGGGLTGGGLGTGGLGGGGGFGNRNMMGGGGFLGGAQGGMGMNNQQQNSAQGTMGYQVNYSGAGLVHGPVMTNLTPNADFQQRLQASPGMQNASGLQVFTRGDTAILRGQVASDYAKQLAAAMIRLEPGVYEVQNELVVVTPKQ